MGMGRCREPGGEGRVRGEYAVLVAVENDKLDAKVARQQERVVLLSRAVDARVSDWGTGTAVSRGSAGVPSSAGVRCGTRR